MTPLGEDTYNFTAVATDAAGNPSPASSPAVIVTVETTTATTDTSMSLQLSGNNRATAGATFTVSGKLIDAVVDSPLAGKTITFTIDGSSVS